MIQPKQPAIGGFPYAVLDGPQQAWAPDGKFKKGTKVQLVQDLVQDSGSYSVVVSEHRVSERGVRAYVSTASLNPAK